MKQYKKCSVCGAAAGHWEQHWNRDTGWGVCRACIDWLISRGETAEELESNYGKEGIHYPPKETTA